jgi:membrane-associated protease RseP (regulator of RpoE activity)
MKSMILKSPTYLSVVAMLGLGAPARCGEVFATGFANADATPSTGCSDEGDYYIGVVITPVEEALRWQLKLPANAGVLVGDVQEGSPAKRAGIEKHDVILAVSGEAVGTAEDLTKAIRKSAGKEITLSIIHGGEKKDIPVRPERRPFAGEESKKDTYGYNNYQFVQPGIIVTDLHPVDFPDGVSVTVIKEGKKPASIRVSRGGNEWEIRDMKLEALPEDLRTLVEKWLAAPLTSRERIQIQASPYAKAEDVSSWLLRQQARQIPLIKNIPVLQQVFQHEGQQLPPKTVERLNALEKRLDETLGEIKAKLERLEKAIEASGKPTDVRR